MLGPSRQVKELRQVRAPVERGRAHVLGMSSLMPCRRRIGLAFALIIVMAALCSHSALAPGLPFTVFGFVHNDKGAPIYGAYVTVQSPIESKTSTTDSQGRYWVTISINGVGDAIKVTASKGDAQGGASGTVPSGSSSLRVDFTIRSAATATSATIPPTTTKASSTTSSRSTMVRSPLSRTRRLFSPPR